MLVVGFPAAAFGTNCFVIAPAAGEECVIVDPGIGVEDNLDRALREHRLRPVAVMLTHGHLDHTFSVAPVCGARGISAYIHPGDESMLADPMSGLSADTAAMINGSGLTFSAPDDVRLLDDGAPLEIAGLSFTVDHAPGHTPGSVLFRLAGVPDGLVADVPLTSTVVAGDVLFAGSIGRTDLQGGSNDDMMRSLVTKVLTLDDDVLVLPGHGQSTTIGIERATNPYLREAARLAGSGR